MHSSPAAVHSADRLDRSSNCDDEDADLVAGFKWYPMKAPHGKFYPAGWKHMPPGRYFVHLHRLIANAQPGELIDHVDRDPLNCRRSNLRRVTPAE